MAGPAVLTRYVPSPIPETGDWKQYVEQELRNISALLNVLAEGQIERSYVVPEKLIDGMIRYADGASWNPGSGRGIYRYDSTTPGWVLLG